MDMRIVRGVRSVPAGPSEQLLPDFYCEHTTLAMNRERRKQVLVLFSIVFVHETEEVTTHRARSVTHSPVTFNLVETAGIWWNTLL